MVEDAISGFEIAPCLLALAVACLPLCLQREEGPVHSRLALLWYLPNPLFCEWARLYLRAFHGKVFSLFLWLFTQFGLPTHVSSLRLSSGRSAPVSTLRMQTVPSCSSLAHCWQTQASRLPLFWKSWLAM